ncbi:MAG: glycosyltransferase family 2 protein [Solirubrobacteraceae bacterium]
MAAAVSAAIVAWHHDPAIIAQTVDGLLQQSAAPLEVIVVDNTPGTPVADALDRGVADLVTVRPGRNVGYAAGCNAAADIAQGDWLFLLNPDARPARDVLERLLDAVDADTAVAGAQILLPDGIHVNAGDNPLHVTGISWSGRYGEERECGPPRDVAVVSGAALLVRSADFEALGGLQPGYFAYHDDVDLAWRARLAGRRVVFVPGAVVEHDYEFEKGDYKWFLLERNRLWTVLSCYSGAALALLAPVLAATELAVLALAVRQGWWREKLRAWRALWDGREDLRAWRRRVQGSRRVGDAALLASMTGALDTPLVRLPGAGVINRLLDGWRRAVIALLAAVRR